MPANLSRPGLRTTRLADAANLSFGQGFAFQTKGTIPPGRLILCVRFVLDAIFTQPGVGQAVQFGEVFRQMVARINIGRRINMTGLGLVVHEVMKTGRFPQFPGDIPATAGAAFAKRIEYTIWYASPLSANPLDGAVPSDVWEEQITGNLGTNAIFAATAPTLSSCTLRCYVDHVAASNRPGKVKIPFSAVYMDEGFATLSPQILKPGAWLYAAIYREVANDRGRITSANLSSVTSKIDGEPQFLNARVEDLASMWNRHTATASVRGTSSPVYNAPVHSLDDQPDQAAASPQASNQIEIAPVLFAPRDFMLSHVHQAASGFQIEAAGTLGAYRLAYGYVEPRSADSLAKAARKMGIMSGKIRAKPASKAGLPAGSMLAKFLPAVAEE